MTDDQPAFAEIWKEYHPRLRFFVRSILDPETGGEIDDVVQEVMFRVYRGLSGIDACRPLKAWIYAVARNYCTDLRRKCRRARGRGFTRAAVDAEREPDRHGPGPLEATLGRELHDDIHEFLDSLGEGDRTTLYLRYFEDLSYREIAGIIGRPEGTVKYRVHCLKERLGHHLQERS